ncbi:MAG: thioesterase [Myxococcales bacterium]|nr:thioesterase [Myxococcales bacterium]
MMPAEPPFSVELICFPYAGGGASLYRAWSRSLPAWITVRPVLLPGRESRFSEPALRSIDAMVDLALREVTPSSECFALFGYSMGALAAFELARRLRAEGRPRPCHLLLAALEAPLAAPVTSLARLPDAEFVQRLRELGTMPAEVLEEPELLELFLPVLRADFSAVADYEYVDQPPLRCPITVYGGHHDPLTSDAGLRAWARMTTGAFALRMLPGDHLFLTPSHLPLLALDVARTCGRS